MGTQAKAKYLNILSYDNGEHRNNPKQFEDLVKSKKIVSLLPDSVVAA